MGHLQKTFAVIFLIAISMTALPQKGKLVFYDATVIDVKTGKLLKLSAFGIESDNFPTIAAYIDFALHVKQQKKFQTLDGNRLSF
jgi:hypothetical protein